jgi:DNA replication protein DnaC
LQCGVQRYNFVKPVASSVDFRSELSPPGLVLSGNQQLAELEMIERDRRKVERRIKAAKFPVVKSLDSFDFAAIPKLNKMQVLELARCEWIERRENVIALGPSGTGKTHAALGLGLAACQKGLSVGFTTASALVSEMMEARDERRLLRLQKQMAACKLLIIDELGFVPLSKTGAELLFELISQRYERGATLITSNLPFDEWTETLRVRASDRRPARPHYPPRQHPRDERRKLPSRPKPRPKGRLKPSQKISRARMRPPLGLRPPGDLMRAPKVAGFYTAAWPDFFDTQHHLAAVHTQWPDFEFLRR